MNERSIRHCPIPPLSRLRRILKLFALAHLIRFHVFYLYFLISVLSFPVFRSMDIILGATSDRHPMYRAFLPPHVRLNRALSLEPAGRHRHQLNLASRKREEGSVTSSEASVTFRID